MENRVFELACVASPKTEITLIVCIGWYDKMGAAFVGKIL